MKETIKNSEENLKKNLSFGKVVLRFIDHKPIKGVVVRADKKKKYWYYWVIWEDFEVTGNDWEDDLISADYIREDKV